MVQYRSIAVSVPARIRAGPGRPGAGPFAGGPLRIPGGDRARSRVSVAGTAICPWLRMR